MGISVYVRHTPEINRPGTIQVALTSYRDIPGLSMLFKSRSEQSRIFEQEAEVTRQKYDSIRGIVAQHLGTVHDFEFEAEHSLSKEKRPWSFGLGEMSRENYLGLLIALRQTRVPVYEARHVVNPDSQINPDSAKRILDDLVSRTYKGTNGNGHGLTQ